MISKTIQVHSDDSTLHSRPQKAELKQCDANTPLIRSANQLIFEYYYDITAAELKAYALVQLAYMFNTIYGRGEYRLVQIDKYRRKLILITFRQVISGRRVSNCEKNIWKERDWLKEK